jgi:hypothetical protein
VKISHRITKNNTCQTIRQWIWLCRLCRSKHIINLRYNNIIIEFKLNFEIEHQKAELYTNDIMEIEIWAYFYFLLCNIRQPLLERCTTSNSSLFSSWYIYTLTKLEIVTRVILLFQFHSIHNNSMLRFNIQTNSAAFPTCHWNSIQSSRST